MTQERMSKCIANRDEFIWCNEVLNDSESKMSFYFYPSDRYQNCPDWLRDMIFEEIVKRKEELEKEFAEL